VDRSIRHARRAAPRWRAGARGRGRPLASILAAGCVAVSGGAAFAFFSTSQGGLAWTGVGQPEVSASAASFTGQYPGAASVLVPVVVTNGSDGPLTVTALQPDSDRFPTSCPATAWQFSVPTALPTVPPSSSVTVDLSVAMASNAPDSCQGASFSVPVSVQGTLR
jgi:hypothetical protein